MATLIDTLVTQFDFKADTRGLKSVEKGLKRVNDKAATAGALIGKLNKALGLVGASLGLGKLMDYANNWGKIKMKLASTGLAGEALADTLKDLKTVSDNTGTAMLKNAELYQRIAQFMGNRISVQDRIKAIDTLSKSAKVYGVSAEEAERGTGALAKALQSPIVEFRRLRSAMEQSHNIQGILEDHFASLGTTAKAALKKGITSTELVQIFVAANAKMTDSFNKTSLSLVQAKNKLHNSLSKLAGDFRDQTGLTSRLIFFTDWLSGKFNQLSTYVENNKDEFKALGEVIIGIVTVVSGRLAFAFGKLALRFAPMIAGIALVAVAFQDLWVFMRGGESLLGDFLTWLGLSNEDIQALRDTLKALLKGLADFTQGVLKCKWALAILGGVLAALGTLWTVRKVQNFTRALGAFTDKALDAAGATKKLRTNLNNLENSPVHSKDAKKPPQKTPGTLGNVGKTASKVGLGKRMVRTIPTGLGYASRASGIGTAAWLGWLVGEWFSSTNAGKAFATPFKAFADAVMDANPRYNPQKIIAHAEQEYKEKRARAYLSDYANQFTANILRPITEGIHQAYYYSSPTHHALTQNITRNQHSGQNQHYSDNRKQDFHFTIQNANNPAEIQKTITQAVQASNKQQYQSTVLNFDSTIAR